MLPDGIFVREVKEFATRAENRKQTKGASQNYYLNRSTNLLKDNSQREAKQLLSSFVANRGGGPFDL